jgi:3-oxoacyl-[acyl-carrier-protein] synthase III
MYRSRFESLGCFMPEKVVSTKELIAKLAKEPLFDLEELTGIKNRRVRSDSEDSFVLAMNAIKDCLEKSSYKASDLDVIIFTSITKYKYHNEHDLCFIYEPSMSQLIKAEIGADSALNFDVTNACAGMFTGIFMLDNMIKCGAAKNGMVISGELITLISDTAVKEISEPIDDQFASLTVGDSGVAVIMDRSPNEVEGIEIVEMLTFAEFSELCFGMPSTKNCGIAMYTKAAKIHSESIKRVPVYMSALLKKYQDLVEKYRATYAVPITFAIPHQTALKVMQEGVELTIKHARTIEPLKDINIPEVLSCIEEFGNTSSTSHFVVLYHALKDKKIKDNDRMLLVSHASGITMGLIVVNMGEIKA